MAQKIVVCDIDGVCIDPKARLHFIDENDWDGYEKAWRTDVPIEQGIAVYKALMHSYKLLFVTSRSERQRQNTLFQLRQYISPFINNDNLLMRPNDDHESDSKGTPDHILKPQLVKRDGYRLEDIFMVFEDRQSMVDEWRKLGVVVYQTAARLD